MFKRLIALIGAVVVVISCFVVTVAAEDYDSTIVLRPPVNKDTTLANREVCTFGSCTISATTATGVSYTNTYSEIRFYYFSTGYLMADQTYSDGTVGTKQIIVYPYTVRWTYNGPSGSTSNTFSFLEINYNFSDLVITDQALYNSIFGSYNAEDLNQAYDQGKADGIASVDTDAYYQDGYADAMSKVDQWTGGIFEYMVLDLIAYHEVEDLNGNPVETSDNHSNVPFDKTIGGIYFDATMDYLHSKYGDDWDSKLTRVDLVLKFDSGYSSGQAPIDWLASPIFISGSTLVESAKLKTVDNVVLAMSAEDGSVQTKRQFVFSDPNTVKYPVILKEFSVRVGRPGDLLHEFSLWSDSELYGLGYASGYAAGLTSDSAESYNDGYGVGFTDGKIEGLKLGQSGDWKSLMTAVVDAPINTFQSLFNFEILGLDMRVAFGSILALCVILIIIKKVVL